MKSSFFSFSLAISHKFQLELGMAESQSDFKWVLFWHGFDVTKKVNDIKNTHIVKFAAEVDQYFFHSGFINNNIDQ